MRRGAIISALLHIFIVLLIFFGVPSLFAPDVIVEQPIPVEVYTIADETNLPKAAPEPEPEPAKEPEPPARQETIAATPIPPPPPEPAPPPIEMLKPAAELPPEPPPPPEPAVVPAPKPPPPPPEPVAEKPREVPPPPPPKPKPVRVARAESKDKPAPKPKPKPKPEPEPLRSFSSLLKNLAVSPTPGEIKVSATTKSPEPPPEAPPAAVVPTRNAPLSLSVIDAIRRQIEEKWSVPVGARDAGDLEVEIRIVLRPDGAVIDAQIVDRARLARSGEGFFRSMAESAIRAVRRASPLQNLPPEKYDQWREITFRFKPPT